jgi:predicted molibdopterin-dependent oxidoreductase YjgC
MPSLHIDDQPVTVPDGATVLMAARELGVEVPTLCHRDDLPPSASCMVCAVRDEASGRFIPACSTRAQDGMRLDASSDPVHAFRRNALELLFGEHAGDCEAPCRLACPYGFDVPAILRQLAAGEAVGEACPTDCPAPCEKACRRGRHDEAVAIRELFALYRHDGEEAPRRRIESECRLGRLLDGEMAEFLKLAAAAPRTKAVSPATARVEAARCLHCDCRDRQGCTLRHLAREYDASATRRRGPERKRVEILPIGDDYVFEPAKCVSCGVCVRLGEAKGAKASLTFLKRGYEQRIGPPVGMSFAEALGEHAAEIVAACPTGALARR